MLAKIERFTLGAIVGMFCIYALCSVCGMHAHNDTMSHIALVGTVLSGLIISIGGYHE